jgi:hypothetical protein
MDINLGQEKILFSQYVQERIEELNNSLEKRTQEPFSSNKFVFFNFFKLDSQNQNFSSKRNKYTEYSQ